jgi:hypothetical protein
VQQGYWYPVVLYGEGKVTYPDGSVYEGGFVDGQRQGQGRMRLADGREYQGAWEKGQPVGEATAPEPAAPAAPAEPAPTTPE